MNRPAIGERRTYGRLAEVTYVVSALSDLSNGPEWPPFGTSGLLGSHISPGSYTHGVVCFGHQWVVAAVSGFSATHDACHRVLVRWRRIAPDPNHIRSRSHHGVPLTHQLLTRVLVPDWRDRCQGCSGGSSLTKIACRLAVLRGGSRTQHSRNAGSTGVPTSRRRSGPVPRIPDPGRPSRTSRPSRIWGCGS